MPNLCNNQIRIEFPSETEANQFFETIGGVEGSIARSLLPMPAILDGTRAPRPTGDFDSDGSRQALVDDPTNDFWTPELYAERKAEHEALVAQADAAYIETGFSDWYEWANVNWGTKWGDYDPSYDVHGNAVFGHYTTAWGPLNEGFWQHVSEAYPAAQIVVTYDEPGMCFEGTMSFYDGECVFSESHLMA